MAATGIRKSYGALEVLKGIGLQARKGDVVSLIGSSGSGKSTFLRCLNLLERPDAGEIAVGGEAVRIRPGRAAEPDRRQAERLRRRVAMVFQSFNLWHHMTALENVMEAPVHVHGRPRAEAREAGLAMLAKVGLADRADSYPSHLSGGQQQRVAIARALAVEPEVILFDEPTSALDPELVASVLRVMEQLAAEGRTMIVVTHEMGFARDVSSHVLFLHEGRVEEEGPPGRVLGQPDSPRLARFLSSFRGRTDGAGPAPADEALEGTSKMERRIVT